MRRIGDIVLGTVNMADGEFTYGNRIALGEIFADDSLTDYYKLKKAFKEIYGYSCRWLPIKKRVRVLNDILKGLYDWVKREGQLLHYDPTSDEIAAGIKEYSKRVGSLATIQAIATKFSVDPDEVLKWDYGKVFGILFNDLELFKYNKRYSKVMDEKSRHHNRFRS